jgi:DNA-binding transcriptional MerR regulator
MPLKLTELCALTGFSPRQIRELIDKGALPPPEGYGKGARYPDTHVDTLRTIRTLSTAGIPLARMAAQLKAMREEKLPPLVFGPGTVRDRWTRVMINQQVEISVREGGSSDALNRELLERLVAEAERILQARGPG